MSRVDSTYIGPEVEGWRRILLRHAQWMAGSLAIVLAVVCIFSAGTDWKVPSPLSEILFVFFAAMLCAAVWAHYARKRLVLDTPLPRFLQRKLRETYPHLGIKETELVEHGLRQFFLACQRSRGRFLAMPSRVVDSMWHEFILHTRAYREWCDLVVGRFVDHVPAEVLGRRVSTNDGLRRAWYWACHDELISPRFPARVPLLFALDAQLGIAGGFHYTPDCRRMHHDSDRGMVYCGESFSDGSYSGDADGFGGCEEGSESNNHADDDNDYGSSNDSMLDN